jgi:hypothetical protein
MILNMYEAGSGLRSCMLGSFCPKFQWRKRLTHGPRSSRATLSCVFRREKRAAARILSAHLRKRLTEVRPKTPLNENGHVPLRFMARRQSRASRLNSTGPASRRGWHPAARMDSPEPSAAPLQSSRRICSLLEGSRRAFSLDA